MSAKTERMYGKKPTLERGEDGEMGVSKRKEKEPETGAEGAIRDGGEAMPHHVRHVHERHEMHARHAHEHAVHDHMGHGSKKEMHGRHENEAKTLHDRHEKEAEGAGKKEPKKESEVSKVEKE